MFQIDIFRIIHNISTILAKYIFFVVPQRRKIYAISGIPVMVISIHICILFVNLFIKGTDYIHNCNIIVYRYIFYSCVSFCFVADLRCEWYMTRSFLWKNCNYLIMFRYLNTTRDTTFKLYLKTFKLILYLHLLNCNGFAFADEFLSLYIIFPFLLIPPHYFVMS